MVENDLRRELAGREMLRAAAHSVTLQIPLLHALAFAEAVKMHLNTPGPLQGSVSERYCQIRFIDQIESTFERCDVFALVERGELGPGGFIKFAKVHALLAYSLFCAAAYGARLLGPTTSAAFTVRCHVVGFAKSIEGDFPTLAQMLIDSQNPDLDSPIPERLLG